MSEDWKGKILGRGLYRLGYQGRCSGKQDKVQIQKQDTHGKQGHNNRVEMQNKNWDKSDFNQQQVWRDGVGPSVQTDQAGSTVGKELWERQTGNS